MGIQVYRDISIDFSNSRYIIVNAKQHDSKSRFIRITCTNVGQKVNLNPDDYSAFIRYRKSDGYGVFNKCIISTNGQIIFELTEQMLSTVGTSYADLVILDVNKSDINSDLTIISADGRIIENNNSLCSTMSFYINVMEKPLDDYDIESSNEFGALNELLLKVGTDYEYLSTVVMVQTESYMNTAKASEQIVVDSTSQAKTSEINAKQYATNAKTSETNAETSEANAKTSEINAKNSEDIAVEKASEALNSQTAAKASEDNAKVSELAAQNYRKDVEDYAKISRSYAVGDTDLRKGEVSDCAKYYYEQSKQISEGLNGALLPMGTITFAQLSIQPKVFGYMYNISDDFESDSTFKDGGNIHYSAGTNVYYTADGYWDCLAGFMVTGIKGDNEQIYRKGNVNLTPENIGAYKKSETYNKLEVDDIISSLQNIISKSNECITALTKRIEELEKLNNVTLMEIEY